MTLVTLFLKIAKIFLYSLPMKQIDTVSKRFTGWVGKKILGDFDQKSGTSVIFELFP